MRLMILKNAIELSKRINSYRQSLVELKRNKGPSDPDVLKLSKQLDRDIVMLHIIMCELRSLKQGYLYDRYPNLDEPVCTIHDRITKKDFIQL
ncbi:aspartyl-phosphate phosphatase Spo0E family protein [Neobacillus drentensis]|uniref:aspartyl-phosphate phosphatase Spo0E family protein n=2 Tax=Bacillaceae TaxID=186817 RepID=UPI0031F3A3D7